MASGVGLRRRVADLPLRGRVPGEFAQRRGRARPRAGPGPRSVRVREAGPRGFAGRLPPQRFFAQQCAVDPGDAREIALVTLRKCLNDSLTASTMRSCFRLGRVAAPVDLARSEGLRQMGARRVGIAGANSARPPRTRESRRIGRSSLGCVWLCRQASWRSACIGEPEEK